MEDLLTYLSGHSNHLIYLGLFSTLVLCGVGLPIPEDIPLITAGFLAYEKQIELPVTFAVALVAVLIGDSLIFFIGRRWGLTILNHKLIRKALPEHRLERVRRYFNRYGDRTIFFARFVVGLRAATFWAAGTLKLRYATFILFDAIAATISVPLFIFLGWYFGGDIDRAMHLLDRIESIFLVVALVGIAALIYWELRRRRPD